jgi:hypothetical protein
MNGWPQRYGGRDGRRRRPGAVKWSRQIGAATVVNDNAEEVTRQRWPETLNGWAWAYEMQTLPGRTCRRPSEGLADACNDRGDNHCYGRVLAPGNPNALSQRLVLHLESTFPRPTWKMGEPSRG